MILYNIVVFTVFTVSLLTMLVAVSYFKLHMSGSCPESTDQTPSVIALSAALVGVILILAVAIFTIILLYTSESDVKVCVCARARVCACMRCACVRV